MTAADSSASPVKKTPASSEGSSVANAAREKASEFASSIENSAKEAVAAVSEKVSPELKIIVGSGLVAFLGCLLPWWRMKALNAYEESFSFNAFGDSTFFLGALIFLGTLVSLTAAGFEILGKRPSFLKKIPFSWLQLTIGSEIALLSLAVLTVLSSPRFSVSGSMASRFSVGPSFGIFLALIGTIGIAFGGFLEMKAGKKK